MIVVAVMRKPGVSTVASTAKPGRAHSLRAAAKVAAAASMDTPRYRPCSTHSRAPPTSVPASTRYALPGGWFTCRCAGRVVVVHIAE